VIRPEWQDEAPRTAAGLDRGAAQLLRLHPAPSGLLDFVDGALIGADVVVVAEGGDDPVRERIVLLLASRRGVGCVRARFFPRGAWLVPACLPILLPFGVTAGRRLLEAVLGAVTSCYDGWHARLNRRWFGSRGFLGVVNDWLATRGDAPVGWREVLAA